MGLWRSWERAPAKPGRSSVLDLFGCSGPVAQLGARFHGMEEVVGSIPTRSTNFPQFMVHFWEPGEEFRCPMCMPFPRKASDFGALEGIQSSCTL